MCFLPFLICLLPLKAAKVWKCSNYFCIFIKYSIPTPKILFLLLKRKFFRKQFCRIRRMNVSSRVTNWGVSHCVGLSVLKLAQSLTNGDCGSPWLVAWEKDWKWQWMPASESCHFNPPIRSTLLSLLTSCRKPSNSRWMNAFNDL